MNFEDSSSGADVNWVYLNVDEKKYSSDEPSQEGVRLDAVELFMGTEEQMHSIKLPKVRLSSKGRV